MILLYSCKNFKSIKDELTLYMTTSNDAEGKKSIQKFDNYDVNKISAIYGANGSGKSNFIESIVFLCNIIRDNIYLQPGDELKTEPHKLSTDEKIEYEIQFIKNNNRYIYGNAFTKEIIFNEYLYCSNDKNEIQLIFERKKESYKYGEEYKDELSKLEGMHRENKFLLSIAANNTKIEKIKKAFLFLKEDILIFGIKDKYTKELVENSWIEMLNSEEEKKNIVINLNKLGVKVKEINEKEEPSSINELLEFLLKKEKDNNNKETQKLKKFLEDMKENKINLKRDDIDISKGMIEFDYGLFSINVEKESRGIKFLFQSLPLVDYIKKNNKVLIWDEIESGLHPNIVNKFLEIFIEETKSKSQLIFSTHNTNILSADILNKDQIWFTKLNEDDRKTELYSLDSFIGIGNNDDKGKEYLKGRYGGVPDIEYIYNSANKEIY